MDAEEKIKILEAGKLGRKALEVASSLIEPGALFLDVAEKTENFIRENGGKPSFPLNLSINNEAAHYTPAPNDKKTFKLNDLSFQINAEPVMIGNVDPNLLHGMSASEYIHFNSEDIFQSGKDNRGKWKQGRNAK